MDRKRLIFFGLLSALGLAGGALGARWAIYGRFHQATDNAYVKADSIAVSAKTPGRIGDVAVEDNSRVSKGDPLVLLESADYAARLAQTRADLAARKASVGTFDRQAELASAQLLEAAAGVRSAEAGRALSARDFDRYAALAKDQYASKQQLDRASAARTADAAALERARAAHAAAEAAFAVVAAQKTQAEAQVAWAEAAVRLAEIDAENTIIRAPIDGVVGDITARAGEFAAVGRRLMSVVPVGDIYVVANFKETQIRRFRTGAPAEIEIDAYPGRKAQGVIESIAPSSGAEFSLLPPENATGNFTKIVQRVPVKIKITKAPDGVSLLPGMSATATVDTRGADLHNAAIFAPREGRDAKGAGAAPSLE